ncbi:MAG: pyridoxal phosphate-dependent aminotransferase [Candidatus Tantalella remota]|nr:pyridoxal phosphate-dependent aminotransferase [Candidatus Tantalella remota]
MRLSEKLLSVEPSATLVITSKAKAMRAAGEDVIILAAGEPDFDTPDVIKDAAIKAIKDGFTKYTPAAGTKTLKEAICSKLKKDNGLGYATDEIVISCGAKHSIYNVLLAICNPGDEVLIVSPYWVSYPEMAKLAGAVPKILKTTLESGFKVSADDIKAALTDKTRAIIINSPSNPAGVVYSEDELKAVAAVCVEAGITIISDEIYEKILYDGREHVSIASLSDEARALTVTINGVSKSHSMTGWRIGYMAGDKKIAGLVSTLQSQSTSNPCSISQAAAECALTVDLDKDIKDNSDMFQKRRDFLVNCITDGSTIRPLAPEGAFYLFCDISDYGLDSMTFAKRLLEETKVAVIPGGPFGDDRFVRISFATDLKTIEEGAERIKKWANEL